MTQTFKKDAILIAKTRAVVEAQRKSLKVNINPDHLKAARARLEPKTEQDFLELCAGLGRG